MKLKPDEAALCLGSNFKNAYYYLNAAVNKIRSLNNIRVIKTTRTIKTKPLMVKTAQRDYLNGLILIKTSFSPMLLLKKLQTVETALYRRRKGEKLPRTIDIDIVLFGNYNLTMKKLVVPIKNLKKRLYVTRLLKEL